MTTVNPPALAYGTALSGQDAVDWAVAVLGAMGGKVTVASVQALVDWFHMEGGGGENNPMNSTQGSGTSINSVGVKDYSTPAYGVTETAATLQNGYYPAIVAALKAGDGLTGGSVASELLTWSGKGYSSVSGGVTVTQAMITAAGSPGAAQGDNNNNSGSSGGGGIISDIAGLGQIGSAISGLAKDFDDVSTAFSHLIDPSFWLRIGMFLAGSALLIAAIYTLVKGNSSGGGSVPIPLPIPV